VVIARPGYRVSRRRVLKRPLPKHHKMTRGESIAFMRERFNAEVME